MTDQKKKIEVETEAVSNSSKNWDEITNRGVDENEASTKEQQTHSEANKKTEGSEVDETIGALDHPSYSELETKLTLAEQQSQKNYDNWLRTKAEYDNFKRRAEKDLTNAYKYAVDKLAQDLIPVLDGLDQGLAIKDFEKVKNEVLHQVHEGMELTYKMLLDTLKKYGIEQVNPEGEIFNPEQHEAMSMQENNGVAPNTVLVVFQKGYLLHGRLLRPARVIVSKAG